VPQFLPELRLEDVEVNCFAFCRAKSGKPKCSALDDIYCLKSTDKCAFFATPESAARARLRSDLLRASRSIKLLRANPRGGGYE
jgi:hypothetical protein